MFACSKEGQALSACLTLLSKTMEKRKIRTPPARMLVAKEDECGPTTEITPTSSTDNAPSLQMEDEIDVAAELEPPIEEQKIVVEEEEIVEEIEEEVVHECDGAHSEGRQAHRGNALKTPIFQHYALQPSRTNTSASFTEESLSLKNSDLTLPNKASHFLYFRCYEDHEIQKEFHLTYDETRKGPQNFLVESRVGLKNTDYYIDLYLWNGGKSTSSKKKIYVGIENNHHYTIPSLQTTTSAGFTGESLSLKNSDLTLPNKAAHLLYFRCYVDHELQKEFPLTIDETRKGPQNFLVEPRVRLKNTDYCIDSYLWNRGKSTSSKKKIYVGIKNNHACWLKTVPNCIRSSPVLVQYIVDYLGKFAPSEEYLDHHLQHHQHHDQEGVRSSQIPNKRIKMMVGEDEEVVDHVVEEVDTDGISLSRRTITGNRPTKCDVT
ncbi:unnamed protein product [Caenorhabditis nigoni]